MANVLIDAAHGGNDFGGILYRRSEKVDTLRLAFEVAQILLLRGINVAFTRVTDSYLSPIVRVRIANSEGGDLLMFIHRTIDPIVKPGLEVGFSFSSVVEVAEVAELAADNISKQLYVLGFNYENRQMRDDYMILNDSQMPAFNIVVGNILSEEDNEFFDAHLHEIANAIANGIIKSLQHFQ